MPRVNSESENVCTFSIVPNITKFIFIFPLSKIISKNLSELNNNDNDRALFLDLDLLKKVKMIPPLSSYPLIRINY